MTYRKLTRKKNSYDINKSISNNKRDEENDLTRDICDLTKKEYTKSYFKEYNYEDYKYKENNYKNEDMRNKDVKNDLIRNNNITHNFINNNHSKNIISEEQKNNGNQYINNFSEDKKKNRLFLS